MNRKGFIIIFEKWYFILLAIIVSITLIYAYLDNEGYIKEGSSLYDAGKFFQLQPFNNTLVEQEILRLTNNERAGHGLKSLKLDDALSLIAREHGEDMYSRDFFEHDNPDGDGPTERAERKGIRTTSRNWIGIAENIGITPIGDVVGCGYISSEEDVAKCAVNGWMQSSGHRENILDTNYDVIGVGVYCTDSNCWNTQDFR